jgi:hypothetical protein
VKGELFWLVMRKDWFSLITKFFGVGQSKIPKGLSFDVWRMREM